MFCILPPMFILVLQQSRLLQVVRLLTFDWSKLCRSHTIHRIYITCCKTSLPWRGKTCNMYRFCFKKKTFFCSLQQLFATCNDLICWRTSLIHGCYNAQNHYSTHFQQCCKTSCTFLLPFLWYLKPLTPKIKIWILLCSLYSFPTEVVGRSW